MADPVLRKLVDRGLGENLAQLQRYGDGQSDPGPGIPAARAMTGGQAQDASTAGGLSSEAPARFARFPAPLAGIVRQVVSRRGGPQVR